MFRLFNHKTRDYLDLDEESMEWVLNSLRLMQNRQQELSTPGALIKEDDLGPNRGQTVPAGSVTEETIYDFFREQFEDVTKLREQIVQLVGRDLTDG